MANVTATKITFNCPAKELKMLYEMKERLQSPGVELSIAEVIRAAIRKAASK